MVHHQPPDISKKKVNYAGKTLVSATVGSKEYEDALAIANEWRLAHIYPINTFQARLRTMVKDMPSAIVAQRLKRMPTIIDKLQRHPSMQLSTMQDIGGVRAIVKDIASVRKVVAQYETSPRFTHILKDKKDYIINPKSDGYRGVHLIYRYNNTLARGELAKRYTGLLLEVQVRTQEQHIWSTAVEAMGTILRQPFKTRGGDNEWTEFFALMASVMAIVEDETALVQHQGMQPIEIYRALKASADKLNAFDIMSGYTFATKIVSEQKSGFYTIIELDMSGKTVQIRSYSKTQSKRAANDYAAIEAETRGDVTKDVVLVSAGEIKSLKRAYPNYFLDINQFIERLRAVIELVENK